MTWREIIIGLGLGNLISSRVLVGAGIRDTNTGALASQLLMRSQEDLVVNINLFSPLPSLYPIRLHEIPMNLLIYPSPVLLFSITAENKERLLSDYIFMRKSFRSRRYRRCLFASPELVISAFGGVGVCVGMNDYAISWVRAGEREREAELDMIKRACCWLRVSFIIPFSL